VKVNRREFLAGSLAVSVLPMVADSAPEIRPFVYEQRLRKEKSRCRQFEFKALTRGPHDPAPSIVVDGVRLSSQ
jgi:hypothetical protein